MNFYRVTQRQKQLIVSDFEVERLTFLQKKSITRLQLMYQKGKIFIKSTNDEHQLLRIMIVAFLVEIHDLYSLQNEVKFQKFKKILYSASLKQFSTKKGLESEQLLKNIAIKLTTIEIGLNSQKQILSLFNKLSFFDQVIMASIMQTFTIDQSNVNFQYLENWFKCNLDTIIKEGKGQEREILILQRVNDELVINSHEIKDNSHGSERSSQIHNVNEQQLKQFLTISHDTKSPLLGRSRGKENINFNQFRFSRQLSRKSRSPVKDNQTRGIWSIFCCSFD